MAVVISVIRVGGTSPAVASKTLMTMVSRQCIGFVIHVLNSIFLIIVVQNRRSVAIVGARSLSTKSESALNVVNPWMAGEVTRLSWVSLECRVRGLEK